jgi:large subunit ribosomal protein L21
MYAVIRTGGKQYRVVEKDIISVEKLPGEPGATIELADVLAIGDGASLTTGTPISGATVSATVVEHGRGDKIIIFKKKRRHNYRRKNGHRQAFTKLRIEAISAGV